MSNEPPPLPTVPHPDARSATQLEPHVRELATLAALMLGAAHSDGRATWPERSAIAAALADFLGHKELPDAVTETIQRFDPSTFDVVAACKSLNLTDSDDRVQLLQLISRVTDADARLNRGEQAYLEKVAVAIGATYQELKPFVSAD